MSLWTLADFLEQTTQHKFEVSDQYVRENVFGGLLGQCVCFEAEARILGNLVALSYEPFSSIYSDHWIAEQILNFLYAYYDLSMGTITKECKYDIFWTLANLNIAEDSEISALISRHPFWLDKVL